MDYWKDGGAKSVGLFAVGAAVVSASVATRQPSTARARRQASCGVVTEFNGEKIVAQNWPAKDNHIVFTEFHY